MGAPVIYIITFFSVPSSSPTLSNRHFADLDLYQLRSLSAVLLAWGKIYLLNGPAPSASLASGVYPFTFASKVSPGLTSPGVPFHVLNSTSTTPNHSSLAKNADESAEMDSDVATSSSQDHSAEAGAAIGGRLLTHIWNGVRSFCSHFDPKKCIPVSPPPDNPVMRNAFTFHTHWSNLLFGASAVAGSGSASESTVISGRDRHDTHTEALRASSASWCQTTLLNCINGFSPSTSPSSAPATSTRIPCQMPDVAESHTVRQAGSAPGSAASTPNTTSVSYLTENGDEDSMNSNTEADICYLQAEVERLIQHEVKTKGIQTHFRNLLNAPSPNLHEILRGIYVYVGSTHSNDSSPRPRELDEPELRRSANVLVGDQTSCETGSVSHQTEDGIAVSVRVENASSCRVDIQ
ncbi:hypothetical protein BT96DRAFT_1009218 [Gymnopus androsaceus JB14]|uniref:Uncharacterized protein n=1 Tax=Gymnopus androsaceus JB14 TaxID=1447944 RepID=A0A6A4GDC4_9AGAR|nr:hypothetical protein BT96DRAFT_1009218 [Gymnopus androsaceus JB14]